MDGVLSRTNEISCWYARPCPLTKNMPHTAQICFCNIWNKLHSNFVLKTCMQVSHIKEIQYSQVVIQWLYLFSKIQHSVKLNKRHLLVLHTFVCQYRNKVVFKLCMKTFMQCSLSAHKIQKKYTTQKVWIRQLHLFSKLEPSVKLNITHLLVLYRGLKYSTDLFVIHEISCIYILYQKPFHC